MPRNVTNKPTRRPMGWSQIGRQLNGCSAGSIPHRLPLVGIFVFASTFLSFGCVRRRMTVRTNPGGAMVYVDKQPVGLTPVSTSYVYYGTRSVEVVRDGYRTEKFLRRFNPPWYAIPPLDFFSETLWPFELRDERVIDVQMSPEPVVANDALIASGEQLRLQASQGVGVPAPRTMTPAVPVLTQPPPPNLGPNPGGVPNNVPIFGPVDANAPIPIPNSGPIASPSPPGWQPGDFLRGLFVPGGQPATSNPVNNVTPGGSYRPEQ